MVKREKNDFYYLGEGAELRFVKTLLEDGKLFIELNPILKPDMFTNPTLQVFVKEMKKYYSERGLPASYRDLEYILKDSDIDLVTEAHYKRTYKLLNSEELNDGQSLATEKCIKVLKTKELEKILEKALSTLKDKGYEEEKVIKLQEDLIGLHSTQDDDEVMAIDLLDRVFTDVVDVKVPTGIKELDTQMKGGITKGSLGLLIAGTGVGKTTLGSIMCIGASLNGYKVLHIFFEDLLEDIGRKYYANLTGRYTSEFISKENRRILAKEIMGNEKNKKALTKNLKPKRMKNGETTVEDIQNYIRNLISNGWKPDMVFIDYMSCLKSSSNEVLRMQNEFQALERCMKKLESFAAETNIAIWVAQQTNRDAFKEDTANNRIGNIQGSFRMTQPASFILYLNRNKERNDYNTANLYLDKCRGCEPKSWENILLNNGTCQIDLSDVIKNNEELEYNE